MGSVPKAQKPEPWYSASAGMLPSVTVRATAVTPGRCWRR